MKDSVVTVLEAVNEIENDYEPFINPEDIALCNDFTPENYESSDFSDSDDEEEDNYYEYEVVDKGRGGRFEERIVED